MSDVDPAARAGDRQSHRRTIRATVRRRCSTLSRLLSSPATRRPRSRGCGLRRLRSPWRRGSPCRSFFLRRASGTLTEQDTIILADFQNTTGEPVFDGALKVALAVALEQSPFLKVFPDDRVRETLRLMQRPADERLTREIAREIARREQLKALVAGSIASLGTPLRARARSDQRGDAAKSWRASRSRSAPRSRC